MPSNFTIGKTLQRIAYYREICGQSVDRYVRYAGSAMEVTALTRQRLDALANPNAAAIKALVDEADAEVIETIQEILQGKEPSALVADTVPLTILDITDIKGIGAKLAKRLYDELGVADLPALKAALDDGRLGTLKGFGPKMLEKIGEHLAKADKKRPPTA